ncbi:MAG TPA: DUF4166 domain-containing protein [Nocardioides sp.]|uniref:DUF4166 domain-containing protein n=1 Tax=Nocardioides sp. TaxID=35761 RepID=UPI002ED7ECEC
MTSIFRSVLGSEFERLHPALQRRFSVGLDSGEACIGTGTMTKVWHAPWARPFVTLGGTRNVLVAKTGQAIPFTIENVPYVDDFGRETVSFVRTFRFPDRPRRFDAQMVLAPSGRHIVDYLGTHQHLASDLHLSVDAAGGLVIRSGEHRLRERAVDLRIPRLLAAEATVRERYDDAGDCFRISVSVAHPWFGRIFGYHGTFRTEYVDAAALGLRAGLRPVREESRM